MTRQDNILTVKELIQQLEEVEDKSMPVVLNIEDGMECYMATAAVERYYVVELCHSFEKFSLSKDAIDDKGNIVRNNK